jgi:hypothetical protein
VEQDRVCSLDPCSVLTAQAHDRSPAAPRALLH